MFQVALVMLLGQRLVHGLLSQGYSGIGQVVEYTAMMLEDNTADFIISNGGWVNIIIIFKAMYKQWYFVQRIKIILGQNYVFFLLKTMVRGNQSFFFSFLFFFTSFLFPNKHTLTS